MRLINRLSVMATVVSTIFLASCAGDVYDPSKEPQAPPAENPFGEGFAAPDGFGWTMITPVKLNIEVKDDFNGQYKYLIEVFTTNPLHDKNATPIAAGVTNGNTSYITEINVPTAIEKLYIRQTDPKQRKEVYARTVPENGGSMNFKLYYTGVDTRATGNTGSAFEAAKRAGFIEPSHKDSEDIKPLYDETKIIPEVPAVSDGYVQYNPGALNAGAKFIIGTEYTDDVPFKDNIRVYESSGRATVFVQGVWDLSASGKKLTSRLDIYVMNGGKIIGSKDITIDAQNTLTIQSGGSVESQGGIFYLGCPAKIYGSINATNVKVNIGTPEIYIGENGSIKATEAGYFNSAQVFNYSILSAGKLEFIKTTVLNKSYIEDCEDILINGSQIFNYGDVKFNGTLATNNNTGTASFINHYQATLAGSTWNNGASVYNDGLVQLTDFYNTAVGEIYNSCAFIIRNEFTFVNLILDNGSITSDWSQTANEWLPVPTITCNQKVDVKMRNSSIIKADNFILGNAPNNIVGEQGEISMIKIRQLTLKNNGKTSISGNLVFEREDTNEYRQLDVTCATTGYDESKHSIESCSGIINGGNEGGDPSDPEFPIIVEDATNYTFAFEDNWPTYGDFDLNDIVATIDKVTFAQHEDGSVGTYILNGTLQAVGASKKLGLGIQFLGFAASNVVELKGIVEGVTSNSTPLGFEANQSNPVIIICNDAHRFIGNSENDRSYVNTLANSSNNKNGAKFEISIEFRKGAVQPKDLNINQLDVFVISKEADTKTKRIEIHVAGHAPTDLGNTKLFGQGNDQSSVEEKRYYLSSENLAWGVVIPTDFAWPLEYKNIKDVYTDFVSWVTTGGKENKDWYNNHNGQVFKK